MSDLPLAVKQIGPYKLERELGRGGMAVIYLAEDIHTAEQVALKVLFTHLVHDRDTLRRFRKEGETGLHLRHPNIVQVYESGQADGYYYIALEYAEKGTLAALMRERRQPIPPAEAIPILQSVASALDYAHQNHILHRDIKPSNILITKNDHVLLSDFGVARRLAADYTIMTMPGHVVGTPIYMSPEQVRNDIDADHRADIYSLGVVAYSMLTGALPFDGDNQLSILRKIVDEPPTPPEVYNASLPPGINYALLKVLAKEPQKRYSNASEFVAALERGRTWQPASNDWSTLFRALTPTPQTVVANSTPPQIPASPPATSRSYRGIALVFATIVIVALLSLFLLWQPIRDLISGPSLETPATQNTTQPLVAEVPTATPTSVTATPTETPMAVANSPTPEVISFVLTNYDDPEIGIHWEIPKGWRQLRRGDSLTIESTDRTIWFFLEQIASDGTEISPQKLLDDYWASGRSMFQDTIVLSDQPRAVTGGAGHEQRLEASIIGGERYQVHLIAVTSAARNYIVGASYGLEKATVANELVDVVLESFAVLSPAPIEIAASTLISEPQEATATIDMHTMTPTATPTVATPTATQEFTAVPAAIATDTLVPTETSTETATPSATFTTTATPTAIATATATNTVAATETPTPSATSTETVAPTETATSTLMPSETPTATKTAPPTRTFTEAPLPTHTPTKTLTATPSPTPSATKSATPTPNRVATLQSAIRLTLTAQPLPTATATPLPTETATSTLFPTSTQLPTFTSAPVLPTATHTVVRQLPTATPIPTFAPFPNNVDAIVVTLLTPGNDATIKDRTEFSWQSNLALPEGYLYEPAFWQGSDDPLQSGRGWGGSTRETKMSLNPKQFLPGSGYYYWGIRILDANGKPLRIASDIRKISVGDISTSSGGENSPPPPPPTNTPQRPD